MRDPLFGHRDPFTGKGIRDKDEWTEWDFTIVSAFQLVNDLTNKHGLLVHEVDNERMDVEAVKDTDKFQAAIDRATKGTPKKGYTPSFGETWKPRLKLRGGEWPTLEEYFKKQAEEAERDAVQ